MKLAITVWDERISPVYDSAHTLLIAQLRNRKISNISYQSFDPASEWSGDELELMGIDVLICGAISSSHAAMIEAKNIELLPFITGNVSRVLESYASGSQLVPEFLMPGCSQE